MDIGQIQFEQYSGASLPEQSFSQGISVLASMVFKSLIHPRQISSAFSGEILLIGIWETSLLESSKVFSTIEDLLSSTV